MIRFLIGAATGILSAFGIGGGTLLLLYLTLFGGLTQYAAAGVNLLYFLCCAPPALYTHLKNHLVCPHAALWGIAAGIPTSVLAACVAAMLDVSLLRRLFGVLLLYIGVTELRARPRADP